MVLVINLQYLLNKGNIDNWIHFDTDSQTITKKFYYLIML